MEDEFRRLKTSFPITLDQEVEMLLSMINVHSMHNAHWGYKFILENNDLEMPIRIYWKEQSLI